METNAMEGEGEGRGAGASPVELTADCKAWLEAQEREFMVPAVEYLTEDEAREYTDDPEAAPGWYSRLSAPGYLDCTEWNGPHWTVEAALEALYEEHGE